MKLCAFALILFVSCNAIPWLATDAELEHALQENSHEDQEFSLDGDAAIVTAARSEGVSLRGYVPPKAVRMPPPMESGVDWGQITIQSVTAIAGAIAALAYRKYDHVKRASREKEKPGQKV